MAARNSPGRDARGYEWLHQLVESTRNHNSHTVAGRQEALIEVRGRKELPPGNEAKTIPFRQQAG
jgi:hypothetical protein